MLAKIEFPFTELTKGESLKQILRTVDLPTPSKKGPQKETKKKAFCFRIKICNVQLVCLLS